MRFPSILWSLATAICTAMAGGISAAWVAVKISLVNGIGEEEGVMRRDSSDIIKVKDLYDVSYSKGELPMVMMPACFMRPPPMAGTGPKSGNRWHAVRRAIGTSKVSSRQTSWWRKGPEAFTDSGKGEMVAWGLDIRGRKGALPFLGRFDCEWNGLPIPTS